MKALFITTQTNDTHNHVDAWDSAFEPAKRIYFNYRGGLGNDTYILNKARAAGDVEVIFYIGSHNGDGIPSFETLREIRKIAPLIYIISDAADDPWHKPIAIYRREECFDLQVGIDGDPQSPVDHVTLTPVDGRIFDSVMVEKDINCGLSGNVSGKRENILTGVGSRCLIRLRGDDYLDHVRFMKRCKMILNVAYTGSGHRYHIKGRVTEAGYAGACLLEFMQSPIKHWFPAYSYLGFKDVEHLKEVIDTVTPDMIRDCAESFSKIVREKYSAAMIYGGILEKLKNVADSN